MSKRKKKNKKGPSLVILAELTLREGLDMIAEAQRKKSAGLNEKVMVHGHAVMRDWDRWNVVAKRELSCFDCGMQATHFQIEKHKNDLVMGFNLNVYSGLHLLTWDHIIPKSLCGSDHPFNGRLACERCNTGRANNMTLQELLWVNYQNPNHIYRPKWVEKPAPMKLLIKDARWLGRGGTIANPSYGICNPFYGQELARSLAERRTYASDESHDRQENHRHDQEHERSADGPVCEGHA